MEDNNLAGRFLVGDTETTGFHPGLNEDRLIEIGFVEMIDGKKTGRVFHEYVDPQREVPHDAYKVHGWSREDLINAGNGQKFHNIAEKLLNFAKGSTLVFHNSPFDMSFLDFEMKNAGYDILSQHCKVFDTLKFANAIYPRQRNNLDALCKRLGVDNSNRDFHGALLDSELLLDVFITMMKDQPIIDLSKTETIIPVRQIEIKPIKKEISTKLPLIEIHKEDYNKHIEKLRNIRPDMSEDFVLDF